MVPTTLKEPEFYYLDHGFLLLERAAFSLLTVDMSAFTAKIVDVSESIAKERTPRVALSKNYI